MIGPKAFIPMGGGSLLPPAILGHMDHIRPLAFELLFFTQRKLPLRCSLSSPIC